ncbi:MAG: HU family DNA-binding protein [Nocardioides sp.]
MNRTDLRDTVATLAGLNPAEADSAISAVFDAISQGLAAGEKVTIGGFGTFETRKRAARVGRNPQTGAEIQIAASVAPAFKPAAAFKRAVAVG